MPTLEVRRLAKTYNSRHIVDGVDFHVDCGEIVGLLGPNGAGKTTCLRMASGMLHPDAGQVLFHGQDVTKWPMDRRSRDGGMVYLAQAPSTFRSLTVEQNLMGILELLGLDRRERYARCHELLEYLGIVHLRQAPSRELSGGDRRRLEIARCLLSDPKVLLLDEPFTGIDPATIEWLQRIIGDLRTRGVAILIADHQVRETLAITDHSYVIHQGRILAHGTPGDVA